MDAFDISILVLLSIGILGLSYYLGCGVSAYCKLKEIAKALPNCPFPLSWQKNRARPVFVLPGHVLALYLQRGTRRNGLYGVAEVALWNAREFKDGTNMMKLYLTVNKLILYLQNQGYKVMDYNGDLKDLKAEVAKIDTLEYLDTPESQVE